MVRRAVVLGAVLIAGVVAVPSPSTPSGAASPAAVVIRVDQVGYASDGPKVGYLMSTTALAGATFTVRSRSGATVYAGTVGASTGPWNVTYRFVYPLDFSGLTAPGRDTLALAGPVGASSPPFSVAAPAALWRGPLANSLRFYQNERDGPDYIPSALRTAPGHLNDRAAMTYATPPMNANGGFPGDLAPLGVTMDASGGWWDAGDYLKFVETTSYAEALLGVGGAVLPVIDGDHGRTVGLHRRGPLRPAVARTDVERLHQDALLPGGDRGRKCQDGERPRPLASPPGRRLLRGKRSRLPVHPPPAGVRSRAPWFGRSARTWPAGWPRTSGCAHSCSKPVTPAFAGVCLRDGEDVYAQADTSPSGRLVTTAPYGFYPETQWRDDMELGATELASAVGPGPRRTLYLEQAARWASAYLASRDQDTLNLYDVGGLAHYELARLMEASDATSLAVTTGQLVGQLRAQLEAAVAVGAATPFAIGYPWSSSDTVSHDAGLSVMANEYDALTGTSTYARQAQGWMDDDLGSNPWGVSFIVGDGTVFPDCLQHQVANLAGSTDGRPPILAGAAVEGPTSGASRGRVDGMVTCPVSGGDPYAVFRGHGAVYRDNVQSYATDEPAIDLTAATPLAMAWLSEPAP